MHIPGANRTDKACVLIPAQRKHHKHRMIIKGASASREQALFVFRMFESGCKIQPVLPEKRFNFI